MRSLAQRVEQMVLTAVVQVLNMLGTYPLSFYAFVSNSTAAIFPNETSQIRLSNVPQQRP